MGKMQNSRCWAETRYTYSGYDGVQGAKGHEFVKIDGITNTAVEMKASHQRVRRTSPLLPPPPPSSSFFGGVVGNNSAVAALPTNVVKSRHMQTACMSSGGATAPPTPPNMLCRATSYLRFLATVHGGYSVNKTRDMPNRLLCQQNT
jgi:hypothetical protein